MASTLVLLVLVFGVAFGQNCTNPSLTSPRIACDDGNELTFGDYCVGSECVGRSSCAFEKCPSTPGICVVDFGVDSPCIPLEPTATGFNCSYSPAQEGLSCGEGAACNGNGQCVDIDLCVGVVCASNICYHSVCQSGKCSDFIFHTGAPCDDNNTATVLDTCNQAGGCVGMSFRSPVFMPPVAAPVVYVDPFELCEAALMQGTREIKQCAGLPQEEQYSSSKNTSNAPPPASPLTESCSQLPQTLLSTDNPLSRSNVPSGAIPCLDMFCSCGAPDVWIKYQKCTLKVYETDIPNHEAYAEELKKQIQEWINHVHNDVCPVRPDPGGVVVSVVASAAVAATLASQASQASQLGQLTTGTSSTALGVVASLLIHHLQFIAISSNIRSLQSSGAFVKFGSSLNWTTLRNGSAQVKLAGNIAFVVITMVVLVVVHSIVFAKIRTPTAEEALVNTLNTLEGLEKRTVSQKIKRLLLKIYQKKKDQLFPPRLEFMLWNFMWSGLCVSTFEACALLPTQTFWGIFGLLVVAVLTTFLVLMVKTLKELVGPSSTVTVHSELKKDDQLPESALPTPSADVEAGDGPPPFVSGEAEGKKPFLDVYAYHVLLSVGFLVLILLLVTHGNDTWSKTGDGLNYGLFSVCHDLACFSTWSSNKNDCVVYQTTVSDPANKCKRFKGAALGISIAMLVHMGTFLYAVMSIIFIWFGRLDFSKHRIRVTVALGIHSFLFWIPLLWLSAHKRLDKASLLLGSSFGVALAAAVLGVGVTLLWVLKCKLPPPILHLAVKRQPPSVPLPPDGVASHAGDGMAFILKSSLPPQPVKSVKNPLVPPMREQDRSVEEVSTPAPPPQKATLFARVFAFFDGGNSGEWVECKAGYSGAFGLFLDACGVQRGAYLWVWLGMFREFISGLWMGAFSRSQPQGGGGQAQALLLFFTHVAFTVVTVFSRPLTDAVSNLLLLLTAILQSLCLLMAIIAAFATTQIVITGAAKAFLAFESILVIVLLCVSFWSSFLQPVVNMIQAKALQKRKKEAEAKNADIEGTPAVVPAEVDTTKGEKREIGESADVAKPNQFDVESVTPEHTDSN